MHAMNESHQVVTAVATAICCSVIFGVVIKYLYEQVGQLKKDLEEMDHKKIDREMCTLQHRQIIDELNEGRSKFRDLLTKNTALAGDVGRVTTQLALILQRLELSIPRLERAAAGLNQSLLGDDPNGR